MPCNVNYTLDDIIKTIDVISTLDIYNHYVIVDSEFSIIKSSSKFHSNLDDNFFTKNHHIVSKFFKDISQKIHKSYPVSIQNHLYFMSVSYLENLDLYFINFRKILNFNIPFHLEQILQPKKVIKLSKIATTQYQLLICYLASFNFSNERIANIINSLGCFKEQKSRSSINFAIEKIRFKFDIPSKEMFTQILVVSGIQKKSSFRNTRFYYPKLLARRA